MTKKYNTNIAIFDGKFVTLYCYNKSKISFEEFIYLQEKAYIDSIKHKYVLFFKHFGLIGSFTGLN